MIRYGVLGALAYLLIAPPVPAQQTAAANRIELGRLTNGAAVMFVRAGSDWGIEIAGGAGARMMQKKPRRSKSTGAGITQSTWPQATSRCRRKLTPSSRKQRWWVSAKLRSPSRTGGRSQARRCRLAGR